MIRRMQRPALSSAQLQAQLDILDKLLADAKAARAERSLAWYAAQFNAQQAARPTSLVVMHPQQEAA